MIFQTKKRYENTIYQKTLSDKMKDEINVFVK